MLISELIGRASVQAGDAAQVKFSPWQLLNAYNDANKIMRKVLLDSFPRLLEKTETIATTSGNPIALEKKALRITDVRIDGGKIYPLDITLVADISAVGKPNNYYMVDMSTMAFYPLPNGEYSARVVYIPTFTEVDDTQDSGYPSEIESLLIGYMASVVQGADTGADTWSVTVGELMGSIDGDVVTIGGYY